MMTNSKTYALPELGYGFGDLEPAYSAELLELHYGKHHQGYVNGANETLQALAEARANQDYDRLNQLQKDLAFNLSGHVMHSIFWRNMTPGSSNTLPDSLSLQVGESFGGMDALREQFLAAGIGIQGSGWAALSWEPYSRSLIVQQIHDHQDNAGSGTLPVLVMDMWEHAYYLQYRNEKKRWTSAFWDLINWQDVDARLWRIQNADVIVDAVSENELSRKRA